MKIDFNQILFESEIKMNSGVLNLDVSKLEPRVKKINEVYFDYIISPDFDLKEITFYIKIKTNMIVESSVTLEDVKYDFETSESNVLTLEERKDELNLIFIEEEIELEDYISQMINNLLPLKIIGNNEKKDPRILSEEEYEEKILEESSTSLGDLINKNK